MKLLALAMVLGVAAQSALSQDLKYLYTRQECQPAPELMQHLVRDYNEQALFTGLGIQIGNTGEAYTGGTMLTVNQSTGTWTLLTVYGDGTACVTAAGTNFEPYSD